MLSEEKVAVQGLIVRAAGQVVLEDFELRCSCEDYVKVRVRACGLCTWEQRVYRGTKPTYPFWGGHELSGIVEAVRGTCPAGLKAGDHVALALMRRCGECFSCRQGLNNHCAYLQPEPAGDLPQGPRGLSSCMLVPAYKVFRLSPDISFEEGALVEPVACVLRSVQKGQIPPGGTALVLGAGTMGLIHTVLLRMTGCHVIVCDNAEASRHTAVAVGAFATFPLTRLSLDDEILDLTDGHGADGVFCTRGGVPTVSLAVKTVARGGRVVLYQSIPTEDVVALSANTLHYREIQLLGTISQTREDFQHAAALLSAHPGCFRFLVTEIVPSTEGRAAFERAIVPESHRIIVSFA